MYVTRRLLRSTLPPTEVAASTVEEPKLATRSTRHSSSKAKSPTAKKKASTPRSQTKPDKPDTPSVEDRSVLHGHGLMVDAFSADKWCEARVLDLNPAKKTAFVHYMGWNSRYDAWVDVAQLSPHRRHTKGAIKKGASWTGKRSLFYGTKPSSSSTEPKAKEEASKASCSVETAKIEEAAAELVPAKPKRTALARKASPVARKKYNRVSSSSSSDEEEGGKKMRTKARGSDPRERNKPRRVVERAIQRGIQVVVETLGEDRERKLRGRSSGNVDLELDVDIRGRFSTSPVSSAEPNDGDDDDDGEDENDQDDGKPQSKTRSRTPTGSKKRASPGDTHCHSRSTRQRIASSSVEHDQTNAVTQPPTDPVDAGTFATKEKLAAIFRLRLHQKQQLMEELSDPNGLSMQDELRRAAAASATTDKPTYSPRTMAANQAYLQHLERQQYCYQQAMLAAGLPTLAGMDNTLYGGIMDPRIIQTRMDDLEHQRMLQQQQIQDYYSRVLAVRERNTSTLAFTTDFLQQAEGTWQKQLEQTTQEGCGDSYRPEVLATKASAALKSAEPEPEKAASSEPSDPAKELPNEPKDAGVCSETRPPQQTVLYECAL